MAYKKTTNSSIEYYDNNVQSSSIIIVVGGLGDTVDGYYIDKLMGFGIDIGYQVVSIRLQSMPNYGLYTIDSDVEDLCQFYKDLNISKYKKVVYLGHSTGCQVLMLYSTQKKTKASEIIVLQAPVSDREYEEFIDSSLEQKIAIAKTLHSIMKGEAKGETRTDTVLYLSHHQHPIRADRFVSLFSKGGKEDFFSIGQCIKHLNKSNTKIFAILSTCDEYKVAPLHKSIEQLKKIKNMQSIYTIQSNHTLTSFNYEKGQYYIEEFFTLLREIIAIAWSNGDC